MSCQILFLFDLDQCLPLEEKLESEALDSYISQVKDVCSQLLKTASHLDGPNLEHNNLAHFSFKFYSSTGYFLVPENEHQKFQEFSEDHFDDMDNALSERFETLLQTSKTNSFKCEDFKLHMAGSSNFKCHSVYLQKALEEVAMLYNWDRPLLHSPVKNQGSKAVPNVNAIYVFTKLPRSNDELGVFLGKKSKRQFNLRDLHDRLFNTSKKSSLNVLKGDSCVSLNVIDTDDLRSHCINEDASIKCMFKKCLASFHGNVIPINAFCSRSCNSASNPYSASTVISSYLDQDKADKLKFNEVTVQWQDQSLCCHSNDNSIEALTIQTFVKNLPEIVVGRGNCHLLWAATGQSIQLLTHFMQSNSYSGVARCGQQIGIVSVIDETSLYLQLVDKQMSSLIMALTEKTFDPKPKMNVKKRLKIRKRLPRLQSKPEESEKFRGWFFESSHVPKTKQTFGNLLTRNKKAYIQAKDDEDELMENVRKAYLPHHLDSNTLMMGRQTSEESLNSNKSGGSSSKVVSRGAELLRLGSKTAELRRGSSEDCSTLSRLPSTANSQSGLEHLDEWKEKFQMQLEHLDLNDCEEMLKVLTKLQYEILLENGEDLSLVAFAKTVVNTILKFLKGQETTFSLEEMMNSYFLVDSNTVGKRKGAKEVRIRDHKLQILFRMEVSWLAPQQELQKSYLEEILVHLRQISIWDSPNEMLSFMQEILANVYVNDQPEVWIKSIHTSYIL